MSHPQLTTNDGYSKMFQPPQPSTPIDYFSTASRKRSRADSSMGKSICRDDGWHTPTCAQTGYTSYDGALSPQAADSGIINDRYRLAGGFDTPGLFANADLETPVELEMNARRSVNDPHAPRFHTTEPALGGPLSRERNGYSRSNKPASTESFHRSTPSWTRLAITLPFSIAGKMFSFGTTVLKGFYAGGGQGYQFESSNNTRMWNAPLDQSIPGSWYEPPSEEFTGDFEQDNDSATRPPPNKRRLTDKDSWVVIGSPDLQASAPPSPKRRPISTPRPTRPRAGSRRSVLAASRRQSYNTSSGSPINFTSPNERKALPRLSMPARATSPSQYSPTIQPFPSPDAEKFARRQAKQERAADRTMNSMSRQLEDLIRQGQAALGTKFTIEDHGFLEDEGFVDDD